jgi:hypothetical protein
MLRFGVEGALAAHYGQGILAWMKSAMFQWIIGIFIVLAVVGTIVSAVAIWRSTRKRGEQEKPALAGAAERSER